MSWERVLLPNLISSFGLCSWIILILVTHHFTITIPFQNISYWILTSNWQAFQTVCTMSRRYLTNLINHNKRMRCNWIEIFLQAALKDLRFFYQIVSSIFLFVFSLLFLQKKRRCIICNIFLSIFEGKFRNIDVIRRLSWVQLVHDGLKKFFVTKTQRKKSREVRSMKWAGQFTRPRGLIHKFGISSSNNSLTAWL